MDRHSFRISERRRVGMLIRLLRFRAGLQLKELAFLADIDASNLSRIEHGKFGVGLDILNRIAFALGCKVVLIPNRFTDD